MKENTLSTFIDILNRYSPTEEDYNTELWSELSPKEQTIIENILIQKSQNEDSRAIITIGRLKIKGAFDQIKELTQSPNPWIRFSANRAINMLGGSPQGLIEDTKSGDWSIRLGAITSIKGNESKQLFLKGLYDQDYAVRSTSMDKLIELYNLENLLVNSLGKTILEAPLKVLNLLLMADVVPLWQKASADAYFIFNELEKGKSIEDLGLIYKSTAPIGFRNKVTSSFFDYEQPFDVNLIALQSGHDRAWVEAFLAIQLEYKTEARCFRAVEALASLNAIWVLPALKVLLSELENSNPTFIAVENAIDNITNRV